MRNKYSKQCNLNSLGLLSNLVMNLNISPQEGRTELSNLCISFFPPCKLCSACRDTCIRWMDKTIFYFSEYSKAMAIEVLNYSTADKRRMEFLRKTFINDNMTACSPSARTRSTLVTHYSNKGLTQFIVYSGIYMKLWLKGVKRHFVHHTGNNVRSPSHGRGKTSLRKPSSKSIGSSRQSHCLGTLPSETGKSPSVWPAAARKHVCLSSADPRP